MCDQVEPVEVGYPIGQLHVGTDGTEGTREAFKLVGMSTEGVLNERCQSPGLVLIGWNKSHLVQVLLGDDPPGEDGVGKHDGITGEVHLQDIANRLERLELDGRCDGLGSFAGGCDRVSLHILWMVERGHCNNFWSMI